MKTAFLLSCALLAACSSPYPCVELGYEPAPGGTCYFDDVDVDAGDAAADASPSVQDAGNDASADGGEPPDAAADASADASADADAD